MHEVLSIDNSSLLLYDIYKLEILEFIVRNIFRFFHVLRSFFLVRIFSGFNIEVLVVLDSIHISCCFGLSILVVPFRIRFFFPFAFALNISRVLFVEFGAIRSLEAVWKRSCQPRRENEEVHHHGAICLPVRVRCGTELSDREETTGERMYITEAHITR